MDRAIKKQLAQRMHGKARPEPEPTLPQDNDGTGYAKFQAEQTELIHGLEDRFGIALNRHVRIKLKNMDQEFEGKLLMAQLLAPDSLKDELRLRIGSVEFNYAEIEHAVLLEK